MKKKWKLHWKKFLTLRPHRSEQLHNSTFEPFHSEIALEQITFEKLLVSKVHFWGNVVFPKIYAALRLEANLRSLSIFKRKMLR